MRCGRGRGQDSQPAQEWRNSPGALWREEADRERELREITNAAYQLLPHDAAYRI